MTSENLETSCIFVVVEVIFEAPREVKEGNLVYCRVCQLLSDEETAALQQFRRSFW